MPPSEQAEIVVELTPDSPLADVIEMHVEEDVDADVESYYSRNSGLLPHLETPKASDYSREGLPSPIAAEPDTLVNRARDFISMNRPSWLPSR
jgi:hypothetical protein